MSLGSSFHEDVRRGLCASQKWLPPYLFYDEEGGALFDAITRLPEYYPTRTERAIFSSYTQEIVAALFPARPALVSVMELGAGSAEKTQLLLSALAQTGPTRYLPADVDAAALARAVERLRREVASLVVAPFLGHHEEALGALALSPGARALFFIGSSIGNLSDDEAAALLARVRASLARGDSLLLGADTKKELSILLPAYDDAQGVTAAFNKNLLVRLNRELHADFRVDRFLHQARWNEARSCIEMHLVSRGPQEVRLPALGLTVRFQDGESIHTESSAKYDLPRIDSILVRAGFARAADFWDERRWFGVHVARAV